MLVKLAIVVPVYNEAHCVEQVLREWQLAVSQVELDYCFVVIDDGSSDGTPALLDKWQSRQAPDSCHIVTQANRGHGQTCLDGYRKACELGAEWIFQIDSDGQCDPQFFPEIWTKRSDCDVVYGKRVKRLDGWKRVLASMLVRVVVRFSAGADCTDANVPYRLMRARHLRPLLDSIPPDFDLANIALAVQIKRAGWREAFVPIVFRPRTGGEPSVPVARFAQKAVELFVQLRALPRPSPRHD